MVEEICKEQQVAEVHKPRPPDIVHIGGAVTLWHPVVDEQAHRQAHGHLSDLSAGDEHSQHMRHVHTSSTCSVVAVHERVHCKVHGHEPTASGHHVLIRVPGIEEHSDVVEPVQEQEFLLPQHNKSSVT